MADNIRPLENLERYIHEPLSVSADPKELYIRLLVLQPGTGNDRLQCKLLHNVLLRDRGSTEKCNVEYHALSYVWGPPPESYEILIDGKRFPIRKNLWLALNHMRRKDEEITLWTDAICINQEDLIEKNFQVSQMSLLYLQSKKALVWLGEEKESISRIFFDGFKGEHEKSFWLDLQKRWNEKAGAHDEGDTLSWYALLKFVRLEYWTRLWIIQEAVLSHTLELYWGDSVIHWNYVKDTLDALSAVEDDNEHGLEFQKFSRDVSETIVFRICRLTYGSKARHHGKDDIFNLLTQYHESRCFDVRDKVFGMKGISYTDIPVDYSKTPLELSQQVLAIKYSKNRKSFRSGMQNKTGHYVDIMDTVANGEFVTKTLAESNIAPEVAYVEPSDENIRSNVVNTACNISSDICYISETVNLYQGLSLESVRDSLPTLGAVSDQLSKQLQYLYHLVCQPSSTHREVLQNKFLNRCFKMTNSFTYGEEQSLSTDDSPYKVWSEWESALNRALEERQKIDEVASRLHYADASQATEEIIADLILKMTSNMDPSIAKRTKLFCSSSGIVGFAPENAELGDVVCTFRISRTFLVMRQTRGENLFNPVGIASSFSRDMDSDSKPVMRDGTMNDVDVPERLMWLYLDMRTLQTLCSFDCEYANGQRLLDKRAVGGRRRLNPYMR